MDEEYLMTLDKAAPLLGLTDGDTVRLYIWRGRIHATKRGRDWFMTKADIADYLANKKKRGGQPKPRLAQA